MHANLVDKIPTMSLEEPVKNLFTVMDMENSKMHAYDLLKGKTMSRTIQQ
jgi:hypothetical protein